MATRFPLSTIGSDLASFRRAFEPFFPEVSGQATASRLGNLVAGTRALLPLDVYEHGDEVVVLAAAPGMNPEAISISIEKNVVTLSGKIANAADAENAQGSTWFLHELPHGDFKRSLQLPYDVDADQAEATFENGMLRLVLPKQESAKPRQIRINVSSASSSAAALPDSVESEHSSEPAGDEAISAEAAE